MKVAMYSGGKDSIYAAWRVWPVDMFLFLVYEFPRPSPHILNMGKAVEFGAALVPVLVKRLTRGREFEEKVKLLRSLGVGTIVAGDVDVEEHLKYMERLAAEVGASLKEPLWGMDREELVRREVEVLEFIVIGAGRRELLCRRVGRDNVEDFLQAARRLGFDPAGESGEYHSQVVRALGAEVAVNCRPAVEVGGYHIALL
ncbi:MAG: ATPase [Pyrobaculum sp.]